MLNFLLSIVYFFFCQIPTTLNICDRFLGLSAGPSMHDMPVYGDGTTFE